MTRDSLLLTALSALVLIGAIWGVAHALMGLLGAITGQLGAM